LKSTNANISPAIQPAEVEPVNGHKRLAEIPQPEPRHVVWTRMLWEQRRFLGRVTALGLLLATLIAFVLPVRYKSTTSIMPPDDQSGSGIAMLAAFAGKGAGLSSGAMGGSLGSMASDLLGLKTTGELFIAMLQGPTVQDQLIRRFDLRKVYWDRYWVDARKDLTKHTDIDEDRKSGVISIAVTDHDRNRALALTQAYVQALNELVSQVSTSSARRERIFIGQRLKAVKQNLDTASQEFSDYASKTGTLDVPSQAKAMVDSEAQMEGELVAAESELEGLRQIYTPSNIRVRSLQARVGELKHQIENMSGNKANLNSNDSEIAGDFPSIRKLPQVGVRWANLYRETKIQETIYELLTQQYELAKIQEAKEIPTVKVMDAAMLPEKISFPPRLWIILLGAFLSFVLGSAFILGSDTWSRTQSPEKQLATEIWTDLRRQFPTAARRGSAAGSKASRFLHGVPRNGDNGDR
jgi:uncharacterized protein involved in exopolysaccharide biosynthesis